MMNKLIQHTWCRRLFIACSLYLSPITASATSIELQTHTQQFKLAVSYKACNKDVEFCKSPAKLSLSKNKSTLVFQAFDLAHLNILPASLIGHKQSNPHNSQSSFIFNDFNFDGFDDFAVSDGVGGAYGRYSYRIFLYNPKQERFIKHQALSELTLAPYLELFDVDPRQQIITANSKSGCCEQSTETFVFLKGDLTLIKEVIEKYTEQSVTTTIRRLHNNQWLEEVKTENDF